MKTEALGVNTFIPLLAEEHHNSLYHCQIIQDSILKVWFIHPTHGICVKLLEVNSVYGKIFDTIVNADLNLVKN